MKLLRFACFATVSLAFLQNVSGQSFINLDFESARRIVPDQSNYLYPYAVYATSAVPGWTVSGFLGTNDLLFNNYSLGAPSVSLFGTNSYNPPPPPGNQIPPPLDGKLSIDIYGGVPATGDAPTSASISQTGLVPAWTTSLQFIAQNTPYSGPTVLLVSLGNQNIPCSVISAGPNYTLYGGDISAFAGQIEQLTFTALQGVNNYWEIDDIQFVPEPSVFVLFSVCVLFLYWRMKQPNNRIGCKRTLVHFQQFQSR